MSNSLAAAGSISRVATPTAPPRPALLPPADSFLASTPGDASMAAAAQLRMAAATRTGNPIAQIPTALIPDGASTYNAVAKISIFSKNLGQATVNRSASEIDVHTTQGDATLTQDHTNPNLVDVAVPGNSQQYQGTLQDTSNGGVIATTTDGKKVTVTPETGGMEITASGFPQVPSSAKLILTRVA